MKEYREQTQQLMLTRQSELQIERDRMQIQVQGARSGFTTRKEQSERAVAGLFLSVECS